MFYKKGVITNFAKFIGEYLCVWVSYLNRTQKFSCQFCEICWLLLILENSFRKVSGKFSRSTPPVIPLQMNFARKIHLRWNSPWWVPRNFSIAPRYVPNQCVSLSCIIFMSLVYRWPTAGLNLSRISLLLKRQDIEEMLRM